MKARVLLIYAILFLSVPFLYAESYSNFALIQTEHVDVYFASPTTQEYASKVSKLLETSFKKYEALGFRKIKDSPHIFKRKKTKTVIVSSIPTVTEGPHKGLVPAGIVLPDPDYGYRIDLIDSVTDEKFLKSHTAHEAFHIVQYLYDMWEDITFMEATAVAMQDEVFPNGDSYTTKTYEFFEHWKKGESLMSKAGNLEYGASIFFKFLMEKGLDYKTNKPLGPDYLRRLWEGAASKKGPDDLGVLVRRALPVNNDYNDLFLQFAAAVYVKHDETLPELSFKRGKEILYNLDPSKKVNELKSHFFDSVLQYGARYYEYYYPSGNIKKPYRIKIEVPKFAEKNPYQGTLRFGILTIEVGTNKKKFTTYKPKTFPFKSISITTPPVGIDPETKTGIYKFIVIVVNTSKIGQDLSISATAE
ncbi:MAG TPA: hypothetical protein VJB34_01745 [Bdellovibrionota bacterium]|nr:hypothetical protein [Bdellovibrionota bacterium]